MPPLKFISVTGANQHNLKNLQLSIPRNRLIVVTGVSGSGKSSLAFNTLYAEGQRRYVESLSTYARQFLDQMEKPEVESIEGLSPAIAVEQHTIVHNPRSTVGTITELYDFFRLLMARAGLPHCTECGEHVRSQSTAQISDQVLALPPGATIQVFSPVVRGRKGVYRRELQTYEEAGFVRARIDGNMVDLTEPIDLKRQETHDIDLLVDRFVVKSQNRPRLLQALETAVRLADGLVVVEQIGGEEILYSTKLACVECGLSLPELEPRMFSFNSPYGACSECNGLGVIRDFDPDRIVPDRTRSIEEGAFHPWGSRLSGQQYQQVRSLAEELRFRLDEPFDDLPGRAKKVLLYGSEVIETEGVDPIGFEGVIPFLRRKSEQAHSKKSRASIDPYVSEAVCERCEGGRLRRVSLAVTFAGHSIQHYTGLSLDTLYAQILALETEANPVAVGILREIAERLDFMLQVGLHYLTLDRPAASLSGGEAQRIRLATQIGTKLRGVLYVLDEPSIGLHQRDHRRLLDALANMRDLGNTVVVVEHDEETIRRADHIIDLGPGAGADGGELVCEGRPSTIERQKRSLTGQYLSGERQVPIPETRRASNHGSILISGARANNLKDIDVEIPLKVLTVVTGVSGSGKSTLIHDILYRALARRLYRSPEKPGEHDAIQGAETIRRVMEIDQSPIGKTTRSVPATYTKVFDEIRGLYARLPLSRMRGYEKGRFSFNKKSGACASCQGFGQKKIGMVFLPDVYVSCEVCKGRRYNEETVQVRFKEESIADVLEMTVDDALSFFQHIPPIHRRLQILSDVGLGYITLGQSAPTLSGGEAQRLKLARELGKKTPGNALFLLDEPTIGLHFHDIEKLLDVVNRLVDEGNTVVIIEHNFEVIKAADYILDLGPEGGDAGGEIVAQGTPEQLIRSRRSHTAQYLIAVLRNGRPNRSRNAG